MKNLIPEQYKKCNGIYCIHNNKSGKNYIGKTEEGFQKRFTRHNNLLKHNKHFNRYLQNAFNEDKTENFTFYVVYVLQEGESIDDCERGFIFTYREAGECYNFCSGGEGMSGSNNPFFGHHHTEDFKKRLSEQLKESGRCRGENNNFYGEDHSGENNPFYGKHHSAESRQSMSKTKKKMAKEDPKFRQALADKAKLGGAARSLQIARRVICEETGEIFRTMTEAQNKYGCHVGDVCRGTRNTCAGLHFKFI